MTKRVILSWSSGKDSAFALHRLQQNEDIEIAALLTTINEQAERVAMHAVRYGLLKQQAKATNLPLWTAPLPFPCSNLEYEKAMAQVIKRAEDEAITHMAFGDLFLEDVRDYRINMLSATNIAPLFPIWCSEKDTPAVARAILAAGFKARLTCLDPKQLPEKFAGCEYDERFLSALPATVDPCGERGEFHTFCYQGPVFNAAINVKVGDRLSRDGFCFTDVLALNDRDNKPA